MVSIYLLLDCKLILCYYNHQYLNLLLMFSFRKPWR